jgi:tetratricopeptide (TPR) repeat protein
LLVSHPSGSPYQSSESEASDTDPEKPPPEKRAKKASPMDLPRLPFDFEAPPASYTLDSLFAKSNTVMTKFKEAGNSLVKAGDFRAALPKYTEALDAAKSTVTNKEIHVSIQSNMALCHLRLKEWQACIRDASSVVDADPKSFKAIFRRGVLLRSFANQWHSSST